MGLSGSGKSTLLRLLNRLIEPTSGKIFIDNQDVATLNKEDLLQVRRKTMSMVFQNFGLFPHRTILENTEYGLEVQKICIINPYSCTGFFQNFIFGLTFFNHC